MVLLASEKIKGRKARISAVAGRRDGVRKEGEDAMGNGEKEPTAYVRCRPALLPKGDAGTSTRRLLFLLSE